MSRKFRCALPFMIKLIFSFLLFETRLPLSANNQHTPRNILSTPMFCTEISHVLHRMHSFAQCTVLCTVLNAQFCTTPMFAKNLYFNKNSTHQQIQWTFAVLHQQEHLDLSTMFHTPHKCQQVPTECKNLHTCFFHI